jgi:hypothetical protein
MTRKKRSPIEAENSSKTFTLDGPYALLDKLYSDIQDQSDAPIWNSSLRAYRSINCFLTLWHMADWFWVALRRDKLAFENWRHAYPDLPDKLTLQKWLREQSMAMRVAQQVATASKHAYFDHADVGVVADIDYEVGGPRGFKVPIDVIVRIDGKDYSVENVVHEGHIFWQQLLSRALPEPVFIPSSDTDC